MTKQNNKTEDEIYQELCKAERLLKDEPLTQDELYNLEMEAKRRFINQK